MNWNIRDLNVLVSKTGTTTCGKSDGILFQIPGYLIGPVVLLSPELWGLRLLLDSQASLLLCSLIALSTMAMAGARRMSLLAIIPFLSSTPSSGVLAQSPYGTQYSCFFVYLLRMMLFCITPISQLTISCLNIHMQAWSAYRVCGFIEL